jgi:hypothetical protein
MSSKSDIQISSIEMHASQVESQAWTPPAGPAISFSMESAGLTDPIRPFKRQTAWKLSGSNSGPKRSLFHPAQVPANQWSACVEDLTKVFNKEFLDLKNQLSKSLSIFENQLNSRLTALEARYPVSPVLAVSTARPDFEAQAIARLESLESLIQSSISKAQPVLKLMTKPALVPTLITAKSASSKTQTLSSKHLSTQKSAKIQSVSQPQPQPQPQPASQPPTTWAKIAQPQSHTQGSWTTVPKKKISQFSSSASSSSKPRLSTPRPRDLKASKGENKEDRRLIFRRTSVTASKTSREDIILGLNRFFASQQFPTFFRVVDANYTGAGALTVLLDKGALASVLLDFFQNSLLACCSKIDSAITGVELNYQWHGIKIHGIPLARYGDSQGLALAREEIQLGTGIQLMRDPTWLRPIEAIQKQNLQFSTMLITVGSLQIAQKIQTEGLRFGGIRHYATPYFKVGRDSVCPRCCGIGHKSFKACGNRPVCCFICAGEHQASEHACKITICTVKPLQPCSHTPILCANCKGNHMAISSSCPKLRIAKKGQIKPFPRIEIHVPAMSSTSSASESDSSLSKAEYSASTVILPDLAVSGPEVAMKDVSISEESVSISFSPETQLALSLSEC